MIWYVTDKGRIEVRLRAEGQEAIKVARVKADTFIGNIVGDLSATLSVDVVTDEMRYSFSKTRPEVTVIWRARVPEQKVPDVQEYLTRLGQSMGGSDAEVLDGPPDQ